MPTYDLSYLIRMGAGKHPQARDGGYWEASEWEPWVMGHVLSLPKANSITATCALGAAVVALESIAAVGMEQAMLAVRDTYFGDCPNIIGWNDKEGLTREEIADRLDALPGGSPVVVV